MVMIGGGGAQSNCSQELNHLLERLKAPCFPTALGKGTVPDDHPLNLGFNMVVRGPGQVLLEEADLLLVVGSSLDEAATYGWTLPLPEHLIHIDICNEIIGKNYPTALGLVGDAKAILKQLGEELAKLESNNRKTPATRIAALKDEVLAYARNTTFGPYVKAMQKALSPDAIVTNDASMVNGWVMTFLHRSLPRTINITRNLAALGYALPSALGAKIAYPDRQVVAAMGDGGFLFTSEALATAVQEKLNVVALVLNNNSYATIKRMQIDQRNRSIGVDLVNPDFIKLAEAYGALGFRVQSPDHLYEALLTAFAQDLPSVIEIPLEVDQSPFEPS
jgi:acetolactate synthase-1/2/3 large subunit